MNGRQVPSMAQFQAAGINMAGVKDVIWQPQYDSQLYPAAGTSQLQFFSVPVGGGATSAPGATGTKSRADTNMTLSSQIEAPNQFMAVGIEIQFLSGLAPGRGPAAQNTVGQIYNDVNAFRRGGYLHFKVGGKDQLFEGPLLNFPTQAYIDGNAALSDQTTAGANLLSQIEIADVRGATYRFQDTALVSGQSFSVSLIWPAAIALPSTNATSRVFVRLLGWLARGVG